MPCARFGVHAAWLRLVVIKHPVLTGAEGGGPEADYRRARPKRPRFQIFCSPGKLIHRARGVLAKMRRRAAEPAEWAETWELLPGRDGDPADSLFPGAGRTVSKLQEDHRVSCGLVRHRSSSRADGANRTLRPWDCHLSCQFGPGSPR